MTADELTCFVTMVTSTSLAPYVMIMQYLGPYTTGFGTTSQFQGKTFSFLGECIGAQLPPLIKELTNGLSGPIRLTSVASVPTPDEMHAHYVNQDANTLMNALAANTEKSFLKLLFMPNRCAPYFLAAQTPYKAFCMWQSLVATMSDPSDHDDVGAPMLDWFGAACVRSGNELVQRTRLAFSIKWGSVLPDRSLLQWAAKRLAPFRVPAPPLPLYPLDKAAVSISSDNSESVLIRDIPTRS
jgi:hypothetical protein